MRVEVYWNLNKDLYSIRALEGENKNRVVAYRYEVALHNVRFVVRASGQRRARQEGHRNVHAFARGEWVSPATPIETANTDKAVAVQLSLGSITYH